jgi:hypothetical protein
MQARRIVVTGIGALTPIGNNVETYWNNLIDGVSGADMITQFDASKFKTRFACEIKGFDPTEFMDRKEARKLDRFAQIALVASDQAVLDAGITKENVDHDRVGDICKWDWWFNNLHRRGDQFCEWGRHTKIQSVFYSKNDFRYCCRTNFYEAWLQRSELCSGERLCF